MVKASAIPGRVPLGFICGYPVKSSGGELYGGSMFTRSAARDTFQGKAIQEINEKWGEDVLNRVGRETIGIAVCKKKYSPFQFHVVEVNPENFASQNSRVGESPGPPIRRVEVKVERLFGCHCHHARRKEQIMLHGVRPGWQPFGVFSMKKAMEVAKREEVRLNKELFETGNYVVPVIVDDESETTDDHTSIADSIGVFTNYSHSGWRDNPAQLPRMKQTIRLMGDLTWKVKNAYDDIFQEIYDCSESDAKRLFKDIPTKQTKKHETTRKNNHENFIIKENIPSDSTKKPRPKERFPYNEQRTKTNQSTIVPSEATNMARPSKVPYGEKRTDFNQTTIVRTSQIVMTSKASIATNTSVQCTNRYAKEKLSCPTGTCFRRRIFVNSLAEGSDTSKTLFVNICFGFTDRNDPLQQKVKSEGGEHNTTPFITNGPNDDEINGGKALVPGASCTE